MKKIIAFIAALGGIIGWTGCSPQTEPSTAPDIDVIETNGQRSDEENYTVTNIFTEESSPLSAADGELLSRILEDGAWHTEEPSDCLCDFVVTVHHTTYTYHSDCGRFYDSANRRSLSLDDTAKETVNRLLSEAAPLPSDEIPAE